MDLNNNTVNELLNRYKSIIDEMGYPDNISHLLYLIVPSFIIYYGLDNERKIIDTFKSVPIIIKDAQDKMIQAYYMSDPYYIDNTISTRKFIILSNYENIELMQLLDNLIHEYNHAINSMIDEIRFDDKEIKIRTGLCFNTYNRDLVFINKDDSYILEEIINTRQVEEVMDIINSLNNYEIEDSSISTTLYNVKNHINDNYESNSYGLGSMLCKELMNNRTFIRTLANLRLKGNVDDLDGWFDNITGESGSYNRLIKLLKESQELDIELNKSLFKKRKLERIKSDYKEAMDIINTFNNNSNYR